MDHQKKENKNQLQGSLTAKTNCQLPLMPREKLQLFGIDALSDVELLAILLRTGSVDEPVSFLAQKALAKIHEQANYRDLVVEDLMEVKGIGLAKATIILAGIELGSRLKEQQSRKEYVKVLNPEQIADIYIPILGEKQREHFYCILLDTKNNIIGEHEISIGSLNASIVHPREVYKLAVKKSANSVFFIHNHPSGDPTPSREDLASTKRLVEAGDLLGIRVIDHLIIAGKNFISMKRENLF